MLKYTDIVTRIGKKPAKHFLVTIAPQEAEVPYTHNSANLLTFQT